MSRGEEESVAPGEGSHSAALLQRVAAQFGLGLRQVRPDLAIAGSPERTAYRVVIQDARGYLFLLEEVAGADVTRKRAIAATLSDLFYAGLADVQPYLVAADGERVIRVDARYWQIVPYMSGLAVPRPGWIHEGWRGELIADFLLTLRACARRIPVERHGVFSIVAFVRDLTARLARHRPALLPRLEPALALVDELSLVYGSLPVAFCHGDLHPLNILWRLNGIKVVIDWEFCGHKVELYDVANLIGCAGIEDPEGLRGRLVLALLERLRAPGILAEFSWTYLHELVVAVRFAWLSEWLRSHDEEMVELETTFIELLVQRRGMLKGIWSL